jgi:hypothetical protein
MKNPFRWTTFTTLKSQAEVSSVINELLATKTKVIFFSVRHYAGSVTNNEFTIGKYITGSSEFVTMKVRGQVFSGNPTMVNLRFGMPFAIVMMVTFFTVASGFAAFTTLTIDEMTINGVLREPSTAERIFFSLFCSAIPTIIFYFNFIFPTQKLQRVLEEKLQLERKR